MTKRHMTRCSISNYLRNANQNLVLLLVLLFSCSVSSDLATRWTAARQTSLSFTISLSLLKVMSIELMTPSNHLIPFSSYPQSFPASGSFPMSPLFASGGQSIGASASAAVLPMNIQEGFPLGLTGLISLQNHISYFCMFVFILFLVAVCMQDLSSLTRVGPVPPAVEALSAKTVHL